MKTLLQLEELAELLFSIYLFSYLPFTWWIYPLLFFTPDLSLVAMLAGQRLGEPIYNCQSYNGTMAYSRSKFLNLLWTLALARRLEGTGIVANALHPGTAWTAMTQSNEPRIMPDSLRLLWPLFRLVQRSGSPEKCARTSIYLASAPEAANISGQYFESSKRSKNPGPAALDRTVQDKAWELGKCLVLNAPSAVITRAPETIPTDS